MSDAVSSNLKVSSSERSAYAMVTRLEKLNCVYEMRWEVGNPIHISYKNQWFENELLLYPERDKLLWEALFKTLEDNGYE